METFHDKKPLPCLNTLCESILSGSTGKALATDSGAPSGPDLLLAKLLAKAGTPAPEIIGVDEVSIRKRHA